MSQNHSVAMEAEEEEDEIWESLSTEDDPPLTSSSTGQEAITTAASSSERGTDNSNRDHLPSFSAESIDRNKKNGSNSLQRIQQKLETRIAIQNNLVNHPIDLFWKRFLLNLLREMWSLEARIRLGLLFLVTGVVTRIFVWSFWYVLYPRTALLSTLLLASFLYVDPFQMQNQIKTIVDMFTSPERLAQTLERLDIQQLRKLSGLIFLFPAFFEMRTLSFLSQMKAETGWTLYNLSLGVSILAVMMYLMRVKGMQPREATYQGMLILYGSALLMSIVTFNVRRLPFLAAPFLTATGTLLLTYNDDDMEWVSRIVRYSLRVTLRDVLASIGTRVNQDEMLQLAILRWISDFWSSNPGAARNDNAGAQSGPQESTSQTDTPDAVDTESRPQPPSHHDTAASPTGTPARQEDVQWDELLPMLTLEIDHMEAEVEELQSSNNGRNDYQNQQQPNIRQPQAKQNASNKNGFDDLQSMLLSLNVDDRAEPAVMAYRRAVESFPPQKRTAFFISLLRRTPALLTVLFHILFGGTKSLLSSFIVLSPFVIMEYFRIVRWISRCQHMPNISTGTVPPGQSIDRFIPSELATADSMTILLCGDSHPTLKPPTLLLVWRNIVSSVSALEVGLTAARCAETTAVAVQFAGDVISLAQFGFEVSQHGLLHGVGIVLKEAISVGGNFSNLEGMDNDTARYTKAAVGAFQSGQRVARNVQRLGEDEHIGAIVQPVLMALDFLSGHGWLWGQKDVTDNSADHVSRSVVIEEVHNDEVDESETKRENGGAVDIDTENEQNRESSLQPSNDFIPVGRSETTTLPIPADLERVPDSPPASLKDPNEDLSIVMEMVAQAYEQNLIEEDEKADFYMKLSMLGKDELSDPAVLSSMKRTLDIILRNGCATTLVEVKKSQDTHFEVLDTDIAVNSDGDLQAVGSRTSEDKQVESDLSNLQIEAEGRTSRNDAFEEGVGQSEVAKESTKREDNNDALLRFGAAAVGVVAGGFLFSMTHRGKNGRGEEYQHEIEQSAGQDEVGRLHSSTVVIEELSEDEDDSKWVSVPQ